MLSSRVERREIAGRVIIVIVEGQRMGRGGRKRKVGQREASGKLKRVSTQAALNELNRREIEKNRAVVLAQPHRRGDDDQRLCCALGRFCKAQDLSREIYAGCEAYAALHARWSSAIEKPRGYENRALGGTTAGPAAEQVRRWKTKLDEIDLTLVRMFPPHVARAVVQLVLDDTDLTPLQAARDMLAIRSALGEVAICTGLLRRNPHPFH